MECVKRPSTWRLGAEYTLVKEVSKAGSLVFNSPSASAPQCYRAKANAAKASWCSTVQCSLLHDCIDKRNAS